MTYGKAKAFFLVLKKIYFQDSSTATSSDQPTGDKTRPKNPVIINVTFFLPR